VRFEQRLRDGIHSGEIVLAFRRWKRRQVVPGRRYRTGIDMVEVESVDLVEPSTVDAVQAHEAGYASAGELLAGLRGDQLCRFTASACGGSAGQTPGTNWPAPSA
jgi:hypothetical protein